MRKNACSGSCCMSRLEPGHSPGRERQLDPAWPSRPNQLDRGGYQPEREKVPKSMAMCLRHTGPRGRGRGAHWICAICVGTYSKSDVSIE